MRANIILRATAGEICYGWEILLSENYIQEWKSPRFITVCVCARLYIRFILLSDGKRAGGWFTRVRKVESQAY